MSSIVMLPILFAAIKIILAVMVINGLILIFSVSMKHRILGIAGCLLPLFIVYLGSVRAYNLVDLFGMLAFILFFATSIYLFARGKKTHWAMGIVCVALSAIFIMISAVFMYYKSISYANEPSFKACFEVMKALNYGQEEYFKEYKRYADNFNALSKYTNVLCGNGVKAGCNLSEKNNFGNQCKYVTLTNDKTGKFKLEAMTNYKIGCYICVTPEGFNREGYWNCEDPKTLACRRAPYSQHNANDK